VIRQELESPSAPPFLDRTAVERLFGIRRRQAIRLLSVCGGYQVGRTFIVPREALLDYLTSAVGEDRVEFAIRRRTRIIDQLEAGWRVASSNRVSLRVPVAEPGPSLPDGVRLLPGLLEVRFGSPVELLEKLFALAQTVSRDFDAFERSVQRDGEL
jgi:hypothetical protein